MNVECHEFAVNKTRFLWLVNKMQFNHRIELIIEKVYKIILNKIFSSFFNNHFIKNAFFNCIGVLGHLAFIKRGRHP